MGHIFNLVVVALIAANIGMSWQRTRSVKFTGFDTLDIIIWRYDAVVGWSCALVVWVAYVGAKL